MLGCQDNATFNRLLACLVKFVHRVRECAIGAAWNILNDRPCRQSAGVATTKDDDRVPWSAGKLAHQLVDELVLANRKMNEPITRIAARRREPAVRTNNFATKSAPSKLGAWAELHLDVRWHEIQGGNPLAVGVCVSHNVDKLHRIAHTHKKKMQRGANFFHLLCKFDEDQTAV
jgi:hypothetical protein